MRIHNFIARFLSTSAALAFCCALLAQSEPAPKKREPASAEKQVQSHRENASGDALANARPAPVASSVLVQPVRTSNSEHADSQPEKHWTEKLAEDPVATFTALLFVATFLLWKATRDLVQGADKTAIHQLRAYLHVQSAEGKFVDSVESEPGRLKVHIRIRNSGKTPAYEVVQWINNVLTDGNPGDFPRPPDEFKKGMGIIAPGGESHWTFDTNLVPPQLKQAIVAGNLAIHVYGEISYKDIFKKAHYTRYHLFLSGEGAAQGHFKNYETGNETDDFPQPDITAPLA